MNRNPSLEGSLSHSQNDKPLNDSPPDDFVSFPTLPDTEVVANRSFSNMISKTLRKVTNNASTLVHSYAAPTTTGAPHTNDIIDTSSLYTQRRMSPAPSESDNEIRVEPAEQPDTSTCIVSVKSTSSLPSPQTSQKTDQPEVVTKAVPPASSLRLPMPTNSASSQVISSPGANYDLSAQLAVPESRSTVPSVLRTTETTKPPQVTSDDRFLRVSTMGRHPASSISKNDVTVVNLDSHALHTNSTSASPHFISAPTNSEITAHQSHYSSAQALQTRISSIFNNLPNDIEVSDDESASDQDTVDPETITSNNDSALTDTSHPQNQIRLRSPHASSASALTPKRTKNQQKKSIPRKISSNLSSSFIDGAKSIINTNLAGVSASTSSIVGSITDRNLRKRRKRPYKHSNNPLKNGGIPKKYWMNDSFVSDCLNCFKPFTTFRRKHHCRFCGQIFCADCTIFISYSQYKEQRQNQAINSSTNSYKDKLRVCKPCYSDVVVYLSDDSSASDDDDSGQRISISDQQASENGSSVGNSDLSTTWQEHPLARLRSYSTNSRKESDFADSPTSIKPYSESSTSLFRATNSHSDEISDQTSPSMIAHRQTPQMAIPTTRAGESVEIAFPSSVIHTNNFQLTNQGNQVWRSTDHNRLPAVGSEISEPTGWFSKVPRRSASVNSTVGYPNSLENLSSFYKAVVKNKYTRMPSAKKADAANKQQNHSPTLSLDPSAQDDLESENEDEKVMSLYTSLNHSTPTTNLPATHNHLSVSMSSVPTLLEFPAMDEKYLPANLSRQNSGKLFDFRPMNSRSNSFIENKSRSNLRSSERARASMRRIKDRRNQKQNKRFSASNSIIPIASYNMPSENGQTNVFNLFDSKFESPELIQDDQSPREISSTGQPVQRTLETNSHSSPLVNLVNGSPKPPSDDLDRPTDDSEAVQVRGNKPDSKVHLDEQFNKALTSMIRQCLEDCDIKDDMQQNRWVKALIKVIKNVEVLRVNDTLDVKQYIKIKKILGGKIEDTSVLNGLFITKDVDSKRMLSSIENPKIALLVFPLEYLKQKEQFISLRIVNSQQSVYISNLVSRLISLEPDIVVVGDTVCGLAIKLLEEANITVISNVKPQVVERISRYTKADIFQSVNDLFFKKGNLGKCRSFEVRRYLFEDQIKTYSFFIGSDLGSGFTICLRGGDEELLSNAKYAVESVVPSAFNSTFEKSFLQDFTLLHKENENENDYGLETLMELMNEESDVLDEPKTACIKSMQQFGIVNYIQLVDKRVLSSSPSVRYPLPKTLENVVDSFRSFMNIHKINREVQALSEDATIDSTLIERLPFSLNMDFLRSNKDTIKVIKFACDSIMMQHLQHFQFRIRLWSNCMKYTTYQLYPIFHKSIHFLHSRISIKYATPCYGPVVVMVNYYSDNDKSLGLFLDQILQESSKICDECGELLMNHYKTYAHGNAKIDLIVEKIDDIHPEKAFKDKNKRVMWSFCPECKLSTPITVMGDDTYFLSLGKFFELNFLARNTYTEENCHHDFFRNHVKYFGFNGYFIRMQLSSIDTYDVVVPKKKLVSTPLRDIEQKLKTLDRVKEISQKFFRSVSKRLNRVKVDTFDVAEAGREKTNELKEKLKTQEEFISMKTMKIHDTTLPTNYLSLNVILRDIQELSVDWDAEFKDFEKKFLPTENEITKITQVHLRNFLMDKFDSDLNSPVLGPENTNNDSDSDAKENGESNAQDVNDIKGEQAHDLSEDQSEENHNNGENPNNTDKVNQMNLAEEKNDRKDPILLGSRRIPSAIIEDKIMQIKQSLEGDNLKSTPKSPSKNKPESLLELNLADYQVAQGPNRVQDLTNYFNQMTLEFQKQREAAREQQTNKYKAIPVANSQPIVEIYDNIEDVVDVGQTLSGQSNVTSPSDTHNDALVSKNADNGARISAIDEASQSSINDIPSDLTRATKAGNKSKGELPQPEKNSLLKSLSNFWADRSATLWDSLDYPLDITEHTFADSEVIVREDEPSSLVAFCLSTNDYKQKIKFLAVNDTGDSGDVGNESLDFSEQFKMKTDHFAKLERKFKKRSDSEMSETSELESIMNKEKSNHLKYQFVDGDTEMSCKIFYSEQFDAFRQACGVDESFIQSLSRCIKWNSKGGKSGSNFLKTQDNRYILKELSKSELESFVSIAPFYFKYISQSTFNTLTTALAKIFGFYQVEFKNLANGKTFRMDFLIMENLFYNRSTTRIFDLKGSMRNRHVKQTGRENEVLLDENMIEYIYESPVFVKEHSKKLLRGSLFNDTSFLSAMDVMDYSLVVGIDDSSAKLYVGIIDWLRTFTWDKRVENWVKGNSLVGKKGKDPTVVTPKQYRARFREAMDRYILEVPDIWYEGAN